MLIQRDYWHVDKPVNPRYVAGAVRSYLLDFSGKATFHGPMLDGIPLVRYGGDRQLRYNPVTICQLALGLHEVWLADQDEASRDRFLRLAQWLVQNQRLHEGAGFWWYDFIPPLPYRGVPLPWASAMAQGLAVSVLLRAHQVWEFGGFVDAARLAVASFRVSVRNGGFNRKSPLGTIFFEEVPSNPGSFVLNGYIYALWGLYEASCYLREANSRELFQEGAEGLSRLLPLYDCGYWSLYDLSVGWPRHVASPYYHRLHVNQLEATSKILADPEFGRRALRWGEFTENRWAVVRALSAKVIFKLVRQGL